MSEARVSGMAWPNPKYLQMVYDKYGKKCEFEVFRKDILPGLYTEIFDMIYNRRERNLQAVFALKDHDLPDGVHDEVSSPIYLRKFSELCYPYINTQIDAIFGFFGTSYDEHVEEYQKEIESDRKISDLIAFEYSQWEMNTRYGGELEGDDYLAVYRCNVATGECRRKC
jgi:hypothetical protein